MRRTASTGLQISSRTPQDPQQLPQLKQLTVEAVAQQLSPPFQASPGCQCEDGFLVLSSNTHWHYWRWLWLPDAEECLPDQFCWNHIAIIIVHKVAHLSVCRHIWSHEWAVKFQAMTEQSHFKPCMSSQISSNDETVTFQAMNGRQHFKPGLDISETFYFPDFQIFSADYKRFRRKLCPNPLTWQFYLPWTIDSG